ncbi:hypothetical protein [Burkholderia sp. BCC1977]|uniref:hypothetical protein n=1 Tax=Burkholderia sp. BCC1977 TaxID=2817440 RepID=UPI002ABD19C3|nr:hypothetical protein [Burkholderia sp. BCC1977]
MTDCVMSASCSRKGRRAIVAGGLCALLAVPLAPTAAVPGAPLQLHSPVRIDGAPVLLSDVADLTPLPAALRERAARLVVLAPLPSLSGARIDARRLVESARRQMPILAPWLDGVSGQEIEIVRRNGMPVVASPPARSPCVELLHALDTGSAPTPAAFRPATCSDSERPRAWRYDTATHIVRAARPLDVGEIVVKPPRQRIASVRRGEIVTRRVQVGATTVVRHGASLADAAEDRSVIVRTVDGETALWHADSTARRQ